MFEALLLAVLTAAMPMLSDNAVGEWYSGDERCVPPKDDGTYSAPYNALEHRQEYPQFSGADRPGWSCSYQRSDGAIVQFGDSRTPQRQWLDVWGAVHDN